MGEGKERRNKETMQRVREKKGGEWWRRVKERKKCTASFKGWVKFGQPQNRRGGVALGDKLKQKLRGGRLSLGEQRRRN